MKTTRTAVIGLALLAMALSSGCAPARRVPASAPTGSSAEQTRTADSLSASLDGLSFVSDGKLFRVSGGAATEIARDGQRKSGVVSVHGDNSLLVTEETGDGAGVVLVRGVGTNSIKTVLRVKSASTLGDVRLNAATGRLYRALDGDPAPRLVVSTTEQGSEEATVALEGSFSGEFDIDELGLGVIYTSATQNPAALRSGGGPKSTVLTAKLATAFSPAVSGSGDRICLTGTKTAGEPIAVWVFDRGNDSLQRLDATSGLSPTHPVFSGDGSWIAFRSGKDGALHAVRTDGTGERKLPFTADDTTIAW
jgi:hypothetical protein